MRDQMAIVKSSLDETEIAGSDILTLAKVKVEERKNRIKHLEIQVAELAVQISNAKNMLKEQNAPLIAKLDKKLLTAQSELAKAEAAIHENISKEFTKQIETVFSGLFLSPHQEWRSCGRGWYIDSNSYQMSKLVEFLRLRDPLLAREIALVASDYFSRETPYYDLVRVLASKLAEARWTISELSQAGFNKENNEISGHFVEKRKNILDKLVERKNYKILTTEMINLHATESPQITTLQKKLDEVLQELEVLRESANGSANFLLFREADCPNLAAELERYFLKVNLRKRIDQVIDGPPKDKSEERKLKFEKDFQDQFADAIKEEDSLQIHNVEKTKDHLFFWKQNLQTISEAKVSCLFEKYPVDASWWNSLKKIFGEALTLKEILEDMEVDQSVDFYIDLNYWIYKLTVAAKILIKSPDKLAQDSGYLYLAIVEALRQKYAALPMDLELNLVTADLDFGDLAGTLGVLPALMKRSNRVEIEARVLSAVEAHSDMESFER